MGKPAIKKNFNVIESCLKRGGDQKDFKIMF